MAQGARIIGSFAEQLKTIKLEVERVHKKLARDTFEALFIPGASRIFSGYYKSNHRVLVNKSSTANLIPAKRPADAKQFQFLDNVEIARATGLSKIDGIKAFSTTLIGTAVPYANILEAVDSTYQKAADIALSKVDVGSN
ncbi:hypothetical protein LCGC14_2493300 [marine sediment metagenome]|uniref:Uncharacterized protein n=1 Tax=marine sediment metagenome TaxID=412755 RepID=A0A0F9DFY6_9ZZZZ